MSDFDPRVPYLVPTISVKQLRAAEKLAAEDIKKARVAIAKIEGFLDAIPNAHSAMMNPIYLKEALESSEIENINTTLLEVLQQRLNPVKKSQSNSQLVVNYFYALNWGVVNLNKINLSTQLIQGLHYRLIPTEDPEYRRVPVYIGDGRGAVRYTPPEAQHISRLIGDWERLVNSSSKIDPLVLASAGHYQFEAIHPFTDGNGRTGRMLLTLHLVHANLLSAPAIHISQYINSNKSRYYQLLRAVTEKGELEQFVRYLIKGFAQQAQHSYRLLRNLDRMRNECKRNIRTNLPSIYSAELIEAIFVNPVQTPVNLAKDLGIHYVTASKYLKELAKAGHLNAFRHGRHNYFVNTRMLELLEEKGRQRFNNQ
jgi:Fic family protein